MKILITGKGSFVGTAVKSFIMNKYPSWIVEELDVKDSDWKTFNFSGYDVVYHVAGIAHVSTDKKLDQLYFRVNRDLAIEVANKVKREKVKQFVFMSSMIIYGKDRAIGDINPVDIDKYLPINAYGQSKLDADLAIQELGDTSFCVSIIRSPVVYGKNAKGNFPKLQKISKVAFIVPRIKNYRSMIYIKNLAAFVTELINHRICGVFYPQNPDYVSTNHIIQKTRIIHSKKTHESFLLAILVKVASFLFPQLNKMYGNKYYDIELSRYDGIMYQLYTTEDSIADMEG